MQVLRMFTDDRAVSPVIGVILMVAVTVILAAVIGTFVLGIGSQVTSKTPTSSFEFQIDDGADDFSTNNDDTIKVTHRGGDEIQKEALSLRIAGKGSVDSTSSDGFSWDTGDDIIGAGDTGTYDESASGASINIEDGDDLKFIWEDPDGEGSAILAEGEV